MTDCTCCGCAAIAHDPVFPEEQRGGERVDAGAFCNYACLVAHVEEEGLTTGATCELDA